MIHEAVLLAGGMGTRLQRVLPDLPKPMAPINGKPFIEYIMDYLITFNIRKFILSVGYKHEAFSSHFSNNYKGVPVIFSVEETPLGTGGGIHKAIALAEGYNILVLNADTMFKLDIFSMYSLHQSVSADITMGLRKMEEISRYGSVETDSNSRVTGFYEKDSKKGYGTINGGVYIFKKDIFEKRKMPEKFSLEKDFLEPFYPSTKIYGYSSDAYFIDIGIPKDYEKAQHELT